MVDIKDKSRAVGTISEDATPEKLVHFDCVETPRDWKEERNRKKSSNAERNADEKVYDKEKDAEKNKDRDKNLNKQKANNRSKETEKDRDVNRNRDQNRDKDRDDQKSPQKIPLNDGHKSSGSGSRSGQAKAERDRGSRRERPREREERGLEASKEPRRSRDRSRDRERRRSGERAERNMGRQDWDFDRSRSSPSSIGGRGSHRREHDAHRREYDSHRREHDPYRREHDQYRGERSRDQPNSLSRRSPPRERRYSSRTDEDYRRDLSPRSGRTRSPLFSRRTIEGHSPRPVSPRRHSLSYRDVQRSLLYARDMSSPRKRTPIRRASERDIHSRMQPDRHRSPEIIPYIRDPISRDDEVYESKKRYSPVVAEYAKMDSEYDDCKDASPIPRKSVFDRISSGNREVTINSKYLYSPIVSENRKRGSGNRTNRVNQNYPDNTVSTLRDLSDRPQKRDREEPPPPPTEPPTSWIEEKRARLRSRIESEDILDMELIILSEKQREYSEKVEQRIRHMGVTTNLITLPPSMGVAEALDSAVRRNLLYAIIILPQHEQHNSITLTILHGRNPQEHKNMPLEDSLCLINLDHQKYEEAIKDGFIQSRGVGDEKNSSLDSTPDKPKLDLDQLSEIVRKFPQAKDSSSESNRNSQELQAKILGLLGSSAIIPSKSDTPVSQEQSTPQFPILPDPALALASFQPPLRAFSHIPGCPPHRMFPPPLPGFPHPAFNFPPGSIPFPPGNPYLPNPGNIPNLLGHPPFSSGFPPRP